MGEVDLSIFGLKLVVVGFQVTIFGRFVFGSVLLAIVGGVISLFGLFVR